MILDRRGRKLEIDYPCPWGYKVIGMDEAGLRGAITEVVQDIPHSVKSSNRSASGKYICFDVDMLVVSEVQRLTIYEGLRRHPAVKIVL